MRCQACRSCMFAELGFLDSRKYTTERTKAPLDKSQFCLGSKYLQKSKEDPSYL